MWGVTVVLVVVAGLFAAVIWGSYWLALRLFGDPERRERLAASPMRLALWTLGLVALIAPGPLLGGYLILRGFQGQVGFSARAAAFQEISPLATSSYEQAQASGSLAVEHGRKMVELGNRMVDHGRAFSDQVWESHGGHWINDGNSLVAQGQAIQQIAVHLKSLTVSRGEAGPAQAKALSEDLLLLRSRSESLLEHGKVMGELSQVLRERAVAVGNPEFLQDASESANVAVAMGETGQRIVEASQAIGQDLAGVRRLLGQVP